MPDPSEAKSLAEHLFGSSAGRRGLVCPGCGREGFYVQNVYYTISGEKRRLRRCRFCGHAASETVPEAVPDGGSEVASG
jgi:hypothetical protein